MYMYLPKIRKKIYNKKNFVGVLKVTDEDQYVTDPQLYLPILSSKKSAQLLKIRHVYGQTYNVPSIRLKRFASEKLTKVERQAET
jgi:hypothetical protein